MAQPRSGDTVTLHYTGRLDDGRIFDSSKKRGPFELTVGENRIIAGLEQAVMQMEPGEAKTVTVPAEQAHGPRRPELVVAVDRRKLPPEIEPTVGKTLQLKQNEGPVVEATVAEVSDRHVVLDANHPLAGEDLTFDLELVEIRARR